MSLLVFTASTLVTTSCSNDDGLDVKADVQTVFEMDSLQNNLETLFDDHHVGRMVTLVDKDGMLHSAAAKGINTFDDPIENLNSLPLDRLSGVLSQLTVAYYLDKNGFTLSTTIGAFLPDEWNQANNALTFEMLFTHSSGLPSSPITRVALNFNKLPTALNAVDADKEEHFTHYNTALLQVLAAKLYRPEEAITEVNHKALFMEAVNAFLADISAELGSVSEFIDTDPPTYFYFTKFSEGNRFQLGEGDNVSARGLTASTHLLAGLFAYIFNGEVYSEAMYDEVLATIFDRPDSRLEENGSYNVIELNNNVFNWVIVQGQSNSLVEGGSITVFFSNTQKADYTPYGSFQHIDDAYKTAELIIKANEDAYVLEEL